MRLRAAPPGPFGDEGDGTTLYRAEWSVEGVANEGRSIRVAVNEGCGGHDTFDHAEFLESDRGLVVVVLSRKPTEGACTAELAIVSYTIDLPRPLGDDEIIQACWREGEPPGCYPEKR